MPGCVITLPKTVSPKTVSERLDLSFGIFARRGENTVAVTACMRKLLTILNARMRDYFAENGTTENGIQTA